MSDKPVLVKPYDLSNLRIEVSRLLSDYKNRTPLERLFAMTNTFVGRPYELEPMGEGKNGRFDQAPPFWLRTFDCVTLVNIGLALMRAWEVEEFEQAVSQINYHDAQNDYLYRTHYSTGTEWNPNAQKHGWVRDVTELVCSEEGEPIAQIAIALVDRPNWFQSRRLSHIRLLKEVEKFEALGLLYQLQKLSFQVDVTHCHLPYIPLSIIFDEKLRANQHIFSQIPDYAIIEIVRPNWDVRDQIGTHLNVSHLGFAFRDDSGQLIFRHASSLAGCVVDVPLEQYLRDRLANPTIKGVNIQKICV